ncbi:MAG: leucine-rich repeat protein [Lachnospiraceae bacterium]|nr:leucine-rich repeat protein [Lachnospiraceae bacterium]
MKKFTLIRSVIVLIASLFVSLYFSFYSITDNTDVKTFVLTLMPGELTNPAVDYTKEMDDSELEAAMVKSAKLAAKQKKPTGEESPEENFIYEGYGSNGLKITGYTGVETKVEIPAIIDKKPVYAIGADCFANNMYLTEIVIPDTVVYIEDSAFAQCSQLTAVELPAYLVSVGANCFADDTALTSVTKRADVESVTHGVKAIYNNAFANCTALTEVYLGGEDFNEVTVEWNAFANCSALTTVELPNNCKYLQDSVFLNCAVLVNITGVEDAVEIGSGCFEGCSSLQSISISGDITNIGSCAFRNCTSLASVSFGERTVTTFEDGNMIVTVIGDNCFEATAISEIGVPGYVECIGGWSFVNCPNLTCFTWQNSGMNQATQVYGECIFENCPSLVDVYMPITVSNASGFTSDDAQHFALHTNSQSIRQYCDEIQLVYDDWNENL